MGEFIVFPDASNDAFLFQLFLMCDLYDAAQWDLIEDVRNMMQGDPPQSSEFVINLIRHNV